MSPQHARLSLQIQRHLLGRCIHHGNQEPPPACFSITDHYACRRESDLSGLLGVFNRAAWTIQRRTLQSILTKARDEMPHLQLLDCGGDYCECLL